METTTNNVIFSFLLHFPVLPGTTTDSLEKISPGCCGSKSPFLCVRGGEVERRLARVLFCRNGNAFFDAKAKHGPLGGEPGELPGPWRFLKVFAVVTALNAGEEESADSAEVVTIVGSASGRMAQYPSG